MEQAIKRSIYLFFTLLVVIGCKNEMTPKEFVGWVEDPKNGLRINKPISDYIFSVQYKPLEYIISMEERKNNISLAVVESRKEVLGEEMDYFNFRIALSKSNQSVIAQASKKEQDYYQLVDYFSYQIKDDLYLLDGSDTIKCQLFQFARNFDLAPYLDFSLAFEKKEGKNRVFVYDDKIFNTGPVKMLIAEKNINTQPHLKFQ